MTVDFQRLFESAPALYMVLAPDPPRFTVVAASDAYLAAVKKRRDELIGWPVFEALPPGPEDTSSRTNSTESFLRAIETGRPDTMAVQRHDIVRPESEGGGYETRFWSAVNTPVLDADGKAVYLLHRVEDVTELVQLREHSAENRADADEQRARVLAMEVEVMRRAQEIQAVNRRLREANDKLGELDRAKTVFFSNISHELRTPLTLILGALEFVVKRNDLPRGAAGDLALAHRNGLRLLKLVNALLEFSRFEAGRAEAHFEATDLGKLTAEVASSFESASDKAGLHLRIDSPPSSRAALVDRDMWERIVLNLVSNAVKYTLEGEIEVTLRDDEEGFELRVRDTGIGIPADALPRIFERFHRIPSQHGRSAEGTGIGLSLVHELVKLHGGRIEVQSERGRGSTFLVRVPGYEAALPAAPSATTPVAAVAPSKEREAFIEEAAGWIAPVDAGLANAQPDDARPLVLLADDNADMREYVARVLRPRFRVLLAEDGQRALELARQSHPALVLTDVMMPRRDGLELLREIRADATLRGAPVILISARAGDEAKGEGLESGADDYLIKPFSERELIARVGANIRLARMREEVARTALQAEAMMELDQRKNAFLAMLSHELRNPLGAIGNSVHILQQAGLGSAQATHAQEVIERQTRHLVHLVDDLLDVSRITQGKMRLRKERLELRAVLREALDVARPAFQRAGVDLRAELGPEQLPVSGDRTRLSQVVGNLLDNAMKFTRAGGQVAVSLQLDGPQHAVLVVRDDGAGIAPDVLATLFHPFVQADETLDRSGGGLGLGLTIVRGLVEAHGGTASAASHGPGTGAEFTVRLPLAERVPARPQTASRDASTGLRSRVLVIEDNLDAAQTLKVALELHGHDVAVAYDGASGLDAARAWAPEVIISDIGLPKLDGYAVAEAVRQDQQLRSVCLVAITGYAALDDVERSLSAGFDYHLSKPADLLRVQRILGECHVRRAAGR